jgi:type IV pilus assembly protein PilY1
MAYAADDWRGKTMKILQKLIFPLGLGALLGAALPAQAAIDLADSPLFSSLSVPGNLALVLSVEYPTAISPSYPSTTAYSASSEFLGYFDPNKCYKYVYNSSTPANSYFTPYKSASTHACSSSSSTPLWSGNYLNWASMQTLDTFRWVLTGGARMTDEVGTTILEKTNNSGQGHHCSSGNSESTPDKTVSGSSLISGATPFTWTSVTTSDWGGKTAMWITGTNVSTCSTSSGTFTVINKTADTAVSSSTDYIAQTSSGKSADASKVYKLYIRVLVCDPTVGVETNCTQYSTTNYKPEGLIQKYSSKLRFAAFGYLNDWSMTKDGGVLRAKMKFVGPTEPVPTSTDVLTNSAAEWSSTTGQFVQNPDSSDATATTSASGVSIVNSGVINYLNKFGKIVTDTGYKQYDPVSELYYAATRYFRNKGNVARYSSLTQDIDSTNKATQMLDGFPVITTWDDPIKYYCQQNFILGIGDVHTNYDGDTPGSLKTSGGTIPTDDDIPSGTATTLVGTREGISGLATKAISNGTYNIAGLAYYMHTNDIRSDLTDSQTVSTYWLDVMEYQTYASKNQYWLATKYGGFDTSKVTNTGDAAYSSTATLPDKAWWSSSDYVGTNGAKTDKRPDNYYTADKADTMKSGLTSAFSQIVSQVTSATSTALASPTPTQNLVGNYNYVASYDPSSWSSYIQAKPITYDASGTPTYGSAVWDARTQLETMTPTSRIIVTCCTSAGAALPFESTSLASATLSSRTYYASFANVSGVASSAQSAANFVSYLRGDHTKEVANGGAYRDRTYTVSGTSTSFRLGDIVDASLTVLGVPSAGYADEYNAGYGTFKTKYASRKTVVYAGANDGMLHAVDGTTTSTGGVELFAYIPSFTYGDSSTAATSGLASLGVTSFTHHYFVNGTPITRDVDFYKTSSPTATTNDWRTLLVGGLGKGGKGYYAIDVTDPTSWTTEATTATKVLWEFTTTHMGYSYGDPLIVKTAKYGWVVVLTSGYNNDDGKGYFFFVNPRTGALLETVATTEGSTSSPLNLAHITAFIPSSANFVADAIYGADLQGNVWRLDVTGTTGSYTAPTKIAQLKNNSNTLQPVTTRPVVEADSDSAARYVMIGTGRLLADSDISSSDQQTFYVVRDGTGSSGGFYTSTTLPDGFSFPITRSNLTQTTNLLSAISTTTSTEMGYYYDLPVDSSTSIASRIVVQPTYDDGVIAFATTLPTSTACDASGSSTIYALSMTTGESVLTSNGTQVASIASADSVRNLSFYSVNGTTRLLAGKTTGGVDQVTGNFSSSGTLKRLNWRVVPVVE